MPSDNAEKLFLGTKPGHLFFKAAIPGALGMLASSLYYLIEGIIVGRVLGSDAFAGLSLAMPFVIINFAVSDRIGGGSAVPIASEPELKIRDLALLHHKVGGPALLPC